MGEVFIGLRVSLEKKNRFWENLLKEPIEQWLTEFYYFINDRKSHSREIRS
jgi:hypothetical protein